MKVGGPSPTYRTARYELSGPRSLGKQHDGEMDSTGLGGFFPILLIFIFCEAGVEGPITCYLVTNVHISRGCWNSYSPALPNTLFKLSLS